MIIADLNKLYPSGTRVTNKELKIKLQSLYNKYGINAVAKASDITKYGYEFVRCKIIVNDKRVNGLQLTIIK